MVSNMNEQNSTFLSRFFDKIRVLVESAETPFSKMAVFVLPILAPIVPASFTSMHIYKLLVEIFPALPNEIHVILAVIVGLVLEMLGYVGAIEFIHSVFILVKNSTNNAYWLPVILTGVAYLFYLLTMFMINVQLGKYFNTPPIINNIVGLLSFITFPTGLLAANHLSQRTEQEQDYVLRQETREDKLKKAALKQGINIFAPAATQVYQSTTTQTNSSKTGDWRTLSDEEKREVVHVLKVEEIMHKYNVGRSTAFSWKSKKV